MVVLMRLDDAVRQRRNVLAAICGWGISSDGSGGLTRPEVDGQMLAMQRFTTYGRLGQITASTLVITGAQDLLVPPANALLLAEKIPSASLHIIADAGHGFFWESPRAVCTLLHDFCALP